jgi:hypothetical protein
VLSGARWCAFKASKILFLQIVRSFVGHLNEIVISIDTTVERRKGPKIKGLGRQRDAVRSAKTRKVLTIGLQWLVASISVKLPYCKQCWALPFFTLLVPPKTPLSSSQNQHDLTNNKKHKKLTEWTVQLIGVIRHWLGKDIKFIIVGDSGFSCHKIAQACVKAGGSLISRLRLDARMFDFPSSEIFRKGRPRLVGKRLPLFSKLLEDKTLSLERAEVDWYNSGKKSILTLTGTALWYAYGLPPTVIRWVLVKDPDGNCDPLVLFSTDTEHTPQRIIEVYVSRWRIEVTFEESRRHLGVETQRQWSDTAIDRTTPCLFASFSIISLMAASLAEERHEEIPRGNTSWYTKDHVTFSDVLAYVRTSILKKKYFPQFDKKPKLGKFSFEEILLWALAA